MPLNLHLLCSDFLFQHQITSSEGLPAHCFVSFCRRSFTLQLIGLLCIIHPVLSALKIASRQTYARAAAHRLCICLCDGGMRLSSDAVFQL